MQQTLLQNGLDLLIYGMGTVVVFLALLVAGTSLMSSIISRFFPHGEEHAGATPQSGSLGVDKQLLAIIQAAIDKHRGRK